MRHFNILVLATTVTALAAGCGVSSQAPTATALTATGASARHLPTVAAPRAGGTTATRAGATLTGIAGNGHVNTWFTTWEHGSIEFEARVSNPGDQPVRFRWDTNGSGWGAEDQPAFEFVAPFWGGFKVTCTLLDSAGKQLDARSVDVTVWQNPTPPPFPPNPPIPPHQTKSR